MVYHHHHHYHNHYHQRVLADQPMHSNSRRHHRKLLQPRHATTEFTPTTSATHAHYHHHADFYHFAQVVCHARAIPRKELWETWAMALVVDAYFRDDRPTRTMRLVDLAAGHGLLSWAWLVLQQKKRGQNNSTTNSV